MASTAANQEAGARLRLHITPFNKDLLDRIIPPSIRPLATNISFHSVQTFPERGFGYVELPAMDAQKLKGKLNGTTLKGTKVHIEEAKPERKRKTFEEDDVDQDAEKQARKKAKKEKRKAEQGVLSGHELEDGRHVKRGWTDGEGKESQKKSKRKTASSSEKEDAGKMLFRTSVPHNMTPADGDGKDKAKKKKKKDKESKRGKDKTVVQEFKKTKKSQDVSGVLSGNHGNLNYEDGKGWVDEDGNVVEAERPSRKSKRREKQRSEESVAEAGAEDPEHGIIDDDEESVEQERINPIAVAEDQAGIDEARPQTPVDTPHVSPTIAKEVHPLEALFKRPITSPTDSTKPRPAPIDTSFSFFDPANADDDEDNDTGMPPQTPHTRRDLEWRSIRSAAPTPDTAAIGRKFSFPFATESQEDEDEDEEMENAEKPQPDTSKVDEEEKGEESAFRKWFYEHRGDFNRGWKKRRRDERKQKRQRENRRLSQKIA